jgi:pilus assembly protein CpaC
MRALAPVLLAATALASVSSLSTPWVHTARAADSQSRGGITIQAGTGKVMHLRTGVTNIFTADPKVAEVRPASPDSLFVWGVAPGTTTVAALTEKGEAVAQFQVTVTPSAYGAKQTGLDIGARSSVKAQETQQGITLSGTVPTPADAARAAEAAKSELPGDGKVENNLKVNSSTQVSLHVRVAEMDRTLVRELGVNWATAGNVNGTNTLLPAALGQHAQFGVETNNPVADSTITPSQFALNLVHGWNLETVIQALSDDSLVHILAEPNLTTMSGEPANFLVGGEFPIPVASTNTSNTISVDFKQYGISLSFVPTVLNKDNIVLHVRPEVSQLDKADGVTFFFGSGTNGTGLSIPALIVRRADTTVQLGSGQSFVIAGLLSDQTTLTGNAIPGMGDIPVLGALFRSDSFQRSQTELVIVVTPYIVAPVNDPNAIRLPTDGWRPPTDIERILFLRQSAPGYAGTMKPMQHIPADAGFMTE